MSIFERVYQLARTGPLSDVMALKVRLEAGGHWSIATFLSTCSVRDRLAVIRTAVYSAAELENAARHT